MAPAMKISIETYKHSYLLKEFGHKADIYLDL
jgi:hypothetical protein